MFISLGILNKTDFAEDYNEDLERELNREKDYDISERNQYIKNGVNLE